MSVHNADDRKILAIIEEERQQEEKKIELRRQLIQCRQQIEDYLKREAYEDLLAFYQTEQMQMLAGIENDVAVFLVILSIYQMELQEGTKQGILFGIHSMKDAQERYLRAKFLMWRLEFKDEMEGLALFMKQNRVSVPFFKYLVHTSSFTKEETAFKLAMILKENKKYGQAFGMLNYVNELSPGMESVFCEMADICMILGQVESAKSCLENIKNSSVILAEYREKWGI